MKNYLLPLLVLWIMVVFKLQATEKPPIDTAPTSLGPDSWQKSRKGMTIGDYKDMLFILNHLTMYQRNTWSESPQEMTIGQKKAERLWKKSLEVKELFEFMRKEQKRDQKDRIVKWKKGFDQLNNEDLLYRALGKGKEITTPHTLGKITSIKYVWTKNQRKRFNELKEHYGEQLKRPDAVPSLFEQALSVFRSSDQKGSSYEESVIQETLDRKFSSAQINDPAMVELQKKSKAQLDSLSKQGLIYPSAYFQALKRNKELYKKKYSKGIKEKTVVLSNYVQRTRKRRSLADLADYIPELNLLSYSSKEDEIENLEIGLQEEFVYHHENKLDYVISLGAIVKQKGIKVLDLGRSTTQFEFHNPYIVDDLSHSLLQLSLPVGNRNNYLSACLKGLTKLQRLDIHAPRLLNRDRGGVCTVYNSPEATKLYHLKKIATIVRQANRQDEEFPQKELDKLMKEKKILPPTGYGLGGRNDYKNEFKFMRVFRIGEVTLQNLWVRKCPPRTDEAKLKFLKIRNNHYPEFNRENILNDVNIRVKEP